MHEPLDTIQDHVSQPKVDEPTVVSVKPRLPILANPLFWIAFAPPQLIIIGMIIGYHLAKNL